MNWLNDNNVIEMQFSDLINNDEITDQLVEFLEFNEEEFVSDGLSVETMDYYSFMNKHNATECLWEEFMSIRGF